MKQILTLSVILILFSCNQSTNNDNKITTTVDSSVSFIPDTNYVVIKYDERKHDFFIRNGKTTELTISELIEIEGIIDSAINKHNLNVDSMFQVSTIGYKRQYLPYLNEKGDKVIWINFNCGSWWNENDKEELVEVVDGGNCHFELTINLTKGSYYDFYVNGYA
ncbi:MAG: hypothetical protein CMC96_07195 [Flavobacteriales bacterium]|nr:hypothetical protein [Flavobacteriales bacterium]|tara:strand:+ start:165 stop:656 length:492 start_codon:yes stop_codon:yes gene_type:complete